MTTPRNDDVRIAIGYDLDEASVRRTESALKQSDKSIQAIGKEAKANSREIGLLARAQENAAKSGQDAAQEARRFADGLREEAQAADDARTSLERRNDAFNALSRNVGLAGDAESNLRTLGGGLGAAGFGGAERAIGVGAELPAALEALPRLKESLAGLPETANAAAEAIGFAGGGAALVGTMGAVAIAAVAFSAILGELEKRFQKAVEVEKARNDAIAEFEAFAAGGGTTAEAQANLEALQQQEQGLLNARQKLQDENEALIDQIKENVSRFGEEASLFDENGRNLQAALQANRESLAELETSLSDIGSQQEQYTAGLESGTLATNDAAAAERELAAERTQGILNEAQQAGELATLRERAARLTQDQIDNELQALDLRRTGLESELAALEASGDTSEEVAERISQLREQLGFLGEQADVLRSTTPLVEKEKDLASARDAGGRSLDEATQRERERSSREQFFAKQAEETARKREEAAQKQAQAQEEARRTQEQYTEAVADARQGFSDAVADIQTGLADTLADNQRQAQDRLNEATLEFNQNELKEERDYQRDIARIRQEARRSEKEATRQRDFDAAIDAREQGAQAVADRRDAEAVANAEQLIAFQQSQQAIARERDSANRDAQLDAQRARRDANIARTRELRDAQAARDAALRNQQQFNQQFVAGFTALFGNLMSVQSQASRAAPTSPASGGRSGGGVTQDDLTFTFGGG